MARVLKMVTFMVLVFAAVVFAEDHDVGDDTDWTRPAEPEFYAKWAATKTFRVGDELEFDFDAGRHDVAVVTKEAFETCDKEKPISHFTTSPVKIMLNTTGPQYYICTIGDHCRFGQKLMVEVVGAGGRSGGGATPGPATSVPGVGGTTTPGSSEPTPAGTTTPTGSSGTTTPAAGNAASSLGCATFLTAFVSAVVALF